MRLSLLVGVWVTAIAAAAAPSAQSPSSIYQFQAQLIDQDGRQQPLDLYRGHPVLVTMFYGSCPATCPLIIDTLRATEQELDPAQRAQLRVLMVSIDPERDTVATLRALTEQRRIDTRRWTLARADAGTVRTLAALLAIQYRRLPSGEFSHSSVITLLSGDGEILASSTKLGTPDDALMANLRK